MAESVRACCAEVFFDIGDIDCLAVKAMKLMTVNAAEHDCADTQWVLRAVFFLSPNDQVALPVGYK
jgi:hypothetical protein